METQRCQHYRFDDGADLYCHLGDSANERIEKHHADAKVVGDGLPGDPPFRHTHDNFNVRGELGVLCRPQAREAGRTGFLDFPDRRDELRKLFCRSSTVSSFLIIKLTTSIYSGDEFSSACFFTFRHLAMVRFRLRFPRSAFRYSEQIGRFVKSQGIARGKLSTLFPRSPERDEARSRRPEPGRGIR